MTNLKRAHSVREVAGGLGVSERLIRRLIADGAIRVVHLGRRVLIPTSELEELLTPTEGPSRPGIKRTT